MSKKPLARGLVAELDWCPDCDIVHLHVGAVTLRLQPSILHDLRDTLSRAVNALDSERIPQERNDTMSATHHRCH